MDKRRAKLQTLSTVLTQVAQQLTTLQEREQGALPEHPEDVRDSEIFITIAGTPPTLPNALAIATGLGVLLEALSFVDEVSLSKKETPAP